MANDYSITITYKLDTGDAAGKAAEAGQRDAKAYENAFKGSVDLTKALKPGDAGRQIGEQAGASLADAIGKSRTLVDRLRGEMLAKAFPQAAAAAAPPQFLPPPSVRGAPEDFARRMQPMISGMEAFAMLLRGAPLLSVAQMAGQALMGLPGMRGGGAAPTRGPEPYRFYGMPTGEAEAIRRAEEVSGAGDRIAEIQAAQRARAGTMAGGAVAGAEGAAGLGAAGLLARFAGPAAVAAAVGVAAYKAAEAIADMGKKGADANTELHDMADTMGVSATQLLALRQHFAGTGEDITNFARAITRSAVTAKEEMPEIEHQVAASSDVMEESNIKVRDSERAVAAARDNRQAATERVSKAEGELVKVQETGAEQREEQARAADLAVSGAQIGLRGAQMRQAQAGIALQFAPQQQRLEDIQGPLTVKSAELGAKGARIAAEEARVRLQQITTGREEDPDVKRRREIRKAALAVEVAQHNVEQADLREQQADVAERQRKTMERRGLGPVGQARQQMLEAAQAEQQAELRVQQTQTAQKRLAIDQEHNTLQMQENEAQRNLHAARQGTGKAADEQQQAEINVRKQIHEAEQARYNDIKTAQKFLQGGEMEPGFDPRRISTEAFRGAISRQGGYEAGGMLEALSKYLQTPGLGVPEQERRVSEILPGVRRGGPTALPRFTRSLARPGAISPEVMKEIEELGGLSEMQRPVTEDTRRREGELAERKYREELTTNLKDSAQKTKQTMDEFHGAVDSSTEGLKRMFLDILSGKIPGGLPAPEGGEIVPSIVRRTPEQIAAERAKKAAEDARLTEEGKKPALPVPQPVEAGRPAEAKPPEQAKPTIEARSAAEAPPTEARPGEKPAEAVAKPEEKPAAVASSLDKLASSAEGAAAALNQLKESAGKQAVNEPAAAEKPVAAEKAAEAREAKPTETEAESVTPPGSTQLPEIVVQPPSAGAPAAAGPAPPPAAAVPAPAGAAAGPFAVTVTNPWCCKDGKAEGAQAGGGAGAPGAGGGGGAAAGASGVRVIEGGAGGGAAADGAGGAGMAGAPGAGDGGVWSSDPEEFRKQVDQELWRSVPPGWKPRTPEEAQRAAAADARKRREQEEAERRRREEEERKRREEEQAAQEMQGVDELATGGLVGGVGSGKSDSNIIRVSKGEYVVTADGSNLKDAIAHFTNGFARGGLVGGFADAVAHIPGYAGGGPVTHASAGGNSLGHHSLDIRTNAGSFTAHVSEDTMEAIRKSSLGGKLSQTGPRPTWYS